MRRPRRFVDKPGSDLEPPNLALKIVKWVDHELKVERVDTGFKRVLLRSLL